MADYSLEPIDHDPFEHEPVDQDPFVTPRNLARMISAPEDTTQYRGLDAAQTAKLTHERLGRAAYDAVVGPIVSGITAPKDAMDGKFDPLSDEGIARAFDSAMIGQAGGLAGGPSGAIGSGPIRARAYHGSPSEFSKFDMNYAGSTTDPGLLGRGLYFTDDVNVALPSPHRYEVDLNLQNPLNIEMSPDWTRKSKIISQALDIPYPTNRADLADWSKKVTDAAKARGHDSIALDYSTAGYNAKEYAVFDDSLIQIMRKFGLTGALSGGAAYNALVDKNSAP